MRIGRVRIWHLGAAVVVVAVASAIAGAMTGAEGGRPDLYGFAVVTAWLSAFIPLAIYASFRVTVPVVRELFRVWDRSTRRPVWYIRLARWSLLVVIIYLTQWIAGTVVAIAALVTSPILLILYLRPE